MLRRDAGEYADVVDFLGKRLVRKLVDFRPGHTLLQGAGDFQLFSDRYRGVPMVACNHDRRNPRRFRFADRVLHLRPRRIDHTDEAKDR
ncbi:hypothetical protein D3C81_1619650 [compost metagenome]